MYVITVDFRIREGREADFLAHMHKQAENSLNREADCHQFDVCTAPNAEGHVFLYEVYTDEAAFQRHLESSHFNDFNHATAELVVSKNVQAWHRIA